MLSTTAKKRNHLYEERALKFRSSHRSNCGVNAPFIASCLLPPEL